MSIRVLYVDDEPDIREVAAMSLELDPEFEVRTAEGGKEALDLTERWAPEVILLDVMMPGMDGPQTFAELQARPGAATIPVIFITARTQAADVRRLLALGAKGVIAKPFDPLQLADEVRRLLGDDAA
jgi:two-component system, OmpR family, response regulator